MGDGLSLARSKALRFLALATAVTVIVNILFLILPPAYSKVIYGTNQFLWSAFSVWILLEIRASATDPNTEYLSKYLALALVPWTATLMLWGIVLPLFYSNDLAYYVSGFGFLACYGVIILGLLGLNRSKQWFLDPSRDRLLHIIAAMAIVGILAFVLNNIDWASPRVPDILILLAYLVADVVILLYCARMVLLNLRDDLKYLVLIIAEFVLVNSIGDIIYQLRWLFSLNDIFSIKTPRITDFVYNVSLIFMVTALLMYSSRAKKRTMEEVNKKLMDTRHLMDSVVMQSPDAMCIFDKKGNLSLVNDTLLCLFDARRSELQEDFNLFTHMAGKYEGMQPHIVKLKAGESAYLPDVLYRRNGYARHLSVKIFPTIGADSEITNYVCVIDDITGRLMVQKELMDSKLQSELYVDIMAHDINNMNQIAMGFMELAQSTMETEGKLDARNIGLLDKPIESLKNSAKLIDNVKKLQKEKSGRLSAREINVQDLLADVIKQYGHIPGREVSISHELACDCRIIGNDLLVEVFANLVGNAIKHSQGPLKIDIKSSLTEIGGKRYCRIIIEDNGPGIHDSLKSQIFNRLDPGGPPRCKGLGLYLARTLVDDHNGTIGVEDRVPGDYMQGSRFIVILPAQ